MLGTKSKKRTFRLTNCIDGSLPHKPGPHRWVNEVIDGIEQDELRVFDPKDASALDWVLDDTGVRVLDAEATVPVSIREWLPVACQTVRWAGDPDRSGMLGFYDHNAARVLWPQEYLLDWPPGPAAFVGEVCLIRQAHDWEGREDYFKFIVAHELTHVFHIMRFIVPAFMNWRRFWVDVLGRGTRSDLAASLHAEFGPFIDRYGHENEKAEVGRYWPSHIDAWWEALRGTGHAE